jgi:lincosamide nucleotidyltransferase A/C/D/E
VTAEDVIELYSTLLERGIQLWLDGGWGIDALLQRQTRSHTDLDAIVAFDQLPALGRLLYERGFALKEIWPENRWVACPEAVALVGHQQPASEVATAFVLWDQLQRVVDIHVVRVGDDGRAVPAWNSHFVFTAAAFSGRGVIAKTRVHCLSAETQVRTHAGYVLPEKQVRDLRLLREQFEVGAPDRHATESSTL